MAIADDPVFYGYTSTSNVMVAVLNHYFKDAYQEFNATALDIANKEMDKLVKQAEADGVAPENILTSVDPELYESKNYLTGHSSLWLVKAANPATSPVYGFM